MHDVVDETVGAKFPFVNREEECKELLRTFHWVDRAARGKMMDKKMMAAICVGSPGVGKSRFARAAVMHLVDDKVNSAYRYGGDAAHEPAAIACVANDIWSGTGLEKEAENTLRDLVDACKAGRNYCVDCDMNPAPSILYQKVLHAHISRATGVDTSVASRALNEIAGIGRVSLRVVLESLGIRPRTATQEGDCVIINFDEAQVLSHETVVSILGEYRQLVTEEHFRVFIIFTGLTMTNLVSAGKSSNFKLLPIVLPLLTNEDMTTIVLSLATRSGCSEIVPRIESGFKSVLFTQLLWWLGGNPRLLGQFLIRVGDEGTIADTLRTLFDVVPTTTSRGKALQYLLECLDHAAIDYFGAAPIDVSVLRGLASLTLAEVEVPPWHQH